MEHSEAQAEAVGRRLAQRIERFSAEQYGLPRTCRLARCRRTGRCSGTALACRAALEAAAAKRAAAPPHAAWDGLALVRQALLIAVAQKEAEAAAGPNDQRRARGMISGRKSLGERSSCDRVDHEGPFPGLAIP